ncbi:MAG: ferredoxin III, nif-specific [Azospirillum sp.]|nr:ferredoxin III, nif-specific [Azospirillum sp.]
MAEYVTGVTRGGAVWTPKFIESIDSVLCIGCGRCYKTCPRDVLTLAGIDEDGGMVDSDDDDAIKKVMSIADAADCIGCEACARSCSKNAIKLEPLAA